MKYDTSANGKKYSLQEIKTRETPTTSIAAHVFYKNMKKYEIKLLATIMKFDVYEMIECQHQIYM